MYIQSTRCSASSAPGEGELGVHLDAEASESQALCLLVVLEARDGGAINVSFSGRVHHPNDGDFGERREGGTTGIALHTISSRISSR